jgi:hypothetical protein
VPALCGLPVKLPECVWSAPRSPSPAPPIVPEFGGVGPASIPLHNTVTPNSMWPTDLSSTIRIVAACIDICLVMMTLYIASMDASTAHIANRKKLRSGGGDDVSMPRPVALLLYEDEYEAIEFLHVKQLSDLIAWHIGNHGCKMVCET